MHLCLVSSYGLRQVSGITTFVVQLGEALAHRGHEVAILGTTPLPAVALASIRYWGVEAHPRLGDLRLCVRTSQLLWRNRREWEIIHSQQGHLQSVVANLIARFQHRRAITTFHMLPPQSRGMRGIWERVWIRLSLITATQSVFVSEHTKDSFRHAGPVVPNGIDTASIGRSLGNRDEIREELGLGGFTIGFAGRKTKNKGFFDFLTALHSLRSAGEDVHGLVTGEEPAENRSEAETRTRELGLTSFISDLGPREDHLRFLAAMDVFVLPSYREGMPLALLEAMAAGLPVVATRVGGVPEVLRDNVDGFLIDPGDAVGLTDRIRRLLRDPILRDTIARRSKARALEFSLDRTASAYEEIYRGPGQVRDLAI